MRGSRLRWRVPYKRCACNTRCRAIGLQTLPAYLRRLRFVRDPRQAADALPSSAGCEVSNSNLTCAESCGFLRIRRCPSSGGRAVRKRLDGRLRQHRARSVAIMTITLADHDSALFRWRRAPRNRISPNANRMAVAMREAEDARSQPGTPVSARGIRMRVNQFRLGGAQPLHERQADQQIQRHEVGVTRVAEWKSVPAAARLPQHQQYRRLLRPLQRLLRSVHQPRKLLYWDRWLHRGTR